MSSRRSTKKAYLRAAAYSRATYLRARIVAAEAVVTIGVGIFSDVFVLACSWRTCTLLLHVCTRRGVLLWRSGPLLQLSQRSCGIVCTQRRLPVKSRVGGGGRWGSQGATGQPIYPVMVK